MNTLESLSRTISAYWTVGLLFESMEEISTGTCVLKLICITLTHTHMKCQTANSPCEWPYESFSPSFDNLVTDQGSTLTDFISGTELRF